MKVKVKEVASNFQTLELMLRIRQNLNLLLPILKVVLNEAKKLIILT